ncbi:putative fatty acyl-CoA reductase CG5065 [Bradysia coprophila]|uniref:putative fatty acyl-CoA reductase CG5065 n=1 Tax=Bradysia coprophila TaxID=38358 RepID=UPI00187D79E8|nr:putative fatty acyl-CoA reductase CG5065 [Bradysia coprophila]
MIFFCNIISAHMARSFRPIAGCRYSSTKSDMQEFYKGKNIFITGSSGFMGKVLLEKILASFPDVGHVYVLIRGKKNQTFSDRLQKLCSEPIFTKYKRVDAKNLSKIVGIEGHFGDHGLNISEKDRKTLTEQVNIIFHVAATVRFEERLDIPMKSIFIGTKSMLSLANDLKQLSSFVYVSTAYSNSNLLMPDEKVYDMKTDGDTILSLYEHNTKEDVDKIVREKYFDGRPNTYCFTKAITEQYIQKYYRHLPVTIARPSAVAGALYEPEPGYCDSPGAISFGIIYQGLGVCRYFPFKEAALVDIVPVDIAINSLLIVAREVGLQAVPVTNVYNVSSTWHWPLTMKQVIDCKLKAFMRSPPATALRPFSRRTTEVSQFEGKLINYFSEMLVAIITDTIAKIRGKNSRVVRLTRFTQSIRDEQADFFKKSWAFPRKNMDDAVARLSERDRELFPAIPIVKCNDEYFYRYWMSLREMVIGEKPDNIDEAHRQQKRLAIRLVALPFVTVTTFVMMITGVYYF